MPSKAHNFSSRVGSRNAFDFATTFCSKRDTASSTSISFAGRFVPRPGGGKHTHEAVSCHKRAAATSSLSRATHAGRTHSAALPGASEQRKARWSRVWRRREADSSGLVTAAPGNVPRGFSDSSSDASECSDNVTGLVKAKWTGTRVSEVHDGAHLTAPLPGHAGASTARESAA